MADTEELDTGRKVPCVRFLQGGKKEVDMREQPVVDLWLRFNQDFRPGAALFVDGKLRHKGSFSEQDCQKFVSTLAAVPEVPAAKTPDLFMLA